MSAVNGVSKPDESSWKVGLINFEQNYLTAETFGFKINASGTALKKKQTFTLVQHPTEQDVIYIRSHLNRYVSADKYGNVSCDSEEAGEAEKFIVEYDKNGSGRWAFQHKAHSNYLGGTSQNFKCFSKTISDQELWTVQLSIHPQVHLRNVNRKRYAHVCGEQLQVTETIPWAEKALLFLDFVAGDVTGDRENKNKKYALKTADNRYLKANGDLSKELTDDARFTLEIRSGQNGGLAFRDCNGYYLTGVGSTATMKSRNKSVGKDELFTLEETHPQVVLYANNNKKVSIKQGVDVSANQGEPEGDREIFQMEFDSQSGKWAFRTVDNKYWKVEAGGGIQAVSSSICKETLFDVEWQVDGRAALRAFNNLYVYNKRTGSLIAGSGAVTEDKEKFHVKIANRPILVLKSDHGFVGLKPTKGATTEIVCSRAAYDVIYVEPCDRQPGAYYLRAVNGQYWSVAKDDGTVKADGSERSAFQLQVRTNRKLTIRAIKENHFIRGEQNGLFKAVGTDPAEANVQWEY